MEINVIREGHRGMSLSADGIQQEWQPKILWLNLQGHAVIDDCHYCQQKNWCNFRKKVLNIKRQEGNMQPQGGAP